MPVMAAGMHPPRPLRLPRQIPPLLDRQRVHVGAQARPPAPAPAPRISATMPVFAMPSWISSTPISRSRAATKAAVSNRSKSSSGIECRCRRQPRISGSNSAIRLITAMTPSCHAPTRGCRPASVNHPLPSRRAPLVSPHARRQLAARHPDRRPRRRPAPAPRHHGPPARPRPRLPLGHRADFDSIAPYTIEEAYEVADAIAAATWPSSATSSATSCSRSSTTPAWPRRPAPSPSPTWSRAIADKMVRRHPHVFGTDSRDKTAEQQTRRLGAHQGRRTLRQPEARQRARRRRRRPPRPHPRRQAAGPRGPRRLRLARRHRRRWPR